MQRIFRLSKVTGVAYELGWDFTSLVQSSSMTFSQYCKYMDRQYLSTCSTSRTFLSDNVFLEFWFAWASCQQIEFRQACLWCGWNPDVLACDGTQLGIPVGKLNITAIDQCQTQEPITPQFESRLERCFLTNRAMGDKELGRLYRGHLNYRARLPLGMVTSLMNVEEETKRTADLAAKFPSLCRELLIDLLRQRFSDTLSVSAVARVFLALSYEASILAFMPTALCHQLCSSVGTLSFQFLSESNNEIRRFNIYLSNLIEATRRESTTVQQHVLDLVKYLIQRVQELCALSITPEPPCPLPSTYNPPKNGRFYYFSETGEQLRQPRLFAKDMKKKKKKSSTYDDVPDGKHCHKTYGKVRKGSPSYIFFFFCPKHGHCYGGHIIDGKEGRKDPSCALYTHLSTAPKVLVYDFACSMEEYSLNRESGYWMNTRIFHDVFHGCTHICSPMFKVRKAEYNFTMENTSICEQFNAYIKRIKPSGEHMTQQNFVFYVQYFLHLWNKRKAERCREVLRSASAAAVDQL